MHEELNYLYKITQLAIVKWGLSLKPRILLYSLKQVDRGR